MAFSREFLGNGVYLDEHIFDLGFPDLYFAKWTLSVNYTTKSVTVILHAGMNTKNHCV